MKKTVGSVCDAYKALSKLILQDIPLRLGIKLYHLRESIRVTYAFACAEEQKAQEAFHAELMNNGRLHFESVEEKEKYLAKIQDILDTEVDLEIIPVDVSGLDGGTLVNLGALDGFVTF